MIKKFLIGLFSLFFIMPAVANVQLTADAIDAVVSGHVDQNKQADVVRAIFDALNRNNGAGVNTRDLAATCVAAGWNLGRQSGIDKCSKFVAALVKASTTDFYHVCKSGVTPGNGGTGQCFKEEFKKVKVDMRSAPYLAKKLVVNKTGDGVMCAMEEKNWWTHNYDDYVPCTSVSKNKFYEVKFDSVREKNDKTRRDGIVRAVCDVLHNAPFTAGGCTGGGTNVSAQFVCWEPTCAAANADACSKIDKDLHDFGFAAKWNDTKCEISFETIRDTSGLKTAFGLDRFAFCRDIQIAANASLDSQIEAYVRSHVNVPVTSFSCVQSDVSYTGGGCTTKAGNIRDDVLKCFVNGQEVDFVFDDLSETRKKISDGGYQGISCIAADGSFDGKRCQSLNEQGCNIVKQQSASVCPDCKTVYWDADKQVCVLPSAKAATNLQKGLEIAGYTGLVVTAVALTVFSGGSASGVWVVVANVGTGLTVAGGTMATASKVATEYFVYTDKFASDLNKCLNSTDVQCAKDMLQKNLQKMVSYEKNLTNAEKKTLDESFAKLFKKIPAEDEFWNWLDDPKVWNCNSRGDCVVKEKTQFWQSVRTIGDVSMILGGVLKSFAQIASTMTQTTSVIRGIGETRRVRIVNDMKNSKAMLKDVSPDGLNSVLTPNSFVQNVTVNGAKFARNSDLAAYLLSQGYKVGDTVELISGVGASVVTATITSLSNVVFNPAALSAIAVGAGDLITKGESIPFVVRRPSVLTDLVDIEDEDVVIEDIAVPDDKPISVPILKPAIPAAPVLPDVEIEDSEIIIDDIVIPDDAPIIVPDLPENKPQPNDDVSNTTSSSGNNTKKSGISGLGAAAIGAGVAGLGVGAALLIGGAGKKGETSGAGTVTSANGDLFNNVRNRANGVIGVVENSNIELVPIETSNGIKENIVSIANHAVVLVKHNNNIIPFMVDTADGVAKWTPFTNVDINSGAFTRYTPKADIMRTAQIAEKLTETLPPLQMQYFASPNAEDLQFASPSMNGYQLINNNALRYLASLFNKNTHLGVFFMDDIDFISGKDYNRPRYV